MSYQQVTLSEVEKILQQHPLLSDGGYGIQRDHADKHTAWRAALLTDASLEAIDKLCDWLHLHISPAKSINCRHGSYSLKHVAEPMIGYTTNGQFIVAALLCGYRMEKKPGYNPHFNMLEKSIKRAIKRADEARRLAYAR